jgi:hypothetical protein
MTTIFDYINDILVYKRKDTLNNIDSESTFNFYLINRWVSMYSTQCCTIVNNTTNWLYPIFDTKQEQYAFLTDILPRVSRKRINYIKKKKTDSPQKSQLIVSILARNLELSEREISLYVESGLIDLGKLEKIYEKN